jgi:hypothetical protein
MQLCCRWVCRRLGGWVCWVVCVCGLCSCVAYKSISETPTADGIVADILAKYMVLCLLMCCDDVSSGSA